MQPGSGDVIILCREEGAVSPESGRRLDPQGCVPAVLDVLVEPVLMIDGAGRVERVNGAAIQVLGADRDGGRPIGDHLARVGARTLDGAPLPPPLHPITRALAQRQAVIGAELLLEIEGRSLTCLVNVVMLTDDDGGPSDRVLAIFHDITEAARLEREVATQASRLEAVVHLVDEGVFVVNDESRLVFVNEAGRRMFNLTEGMSLQERVRRQPLFDPEGRRLPATAYPSSRVLRGELVTGMPVAFDHPINGRRQVRANAHPLRRRDGRIEAVLVAWKDVTEQERARAELEEARESAEEANRLKDEFIAALSHELRTPLQPILGWTEVLRRHGRLDEVTAHALEAIRRNIRQQVRLVDDLLDLSRIVHGKFQLRFESFDLREQVKSAAEPFEEAAALRRRPPHRRAAAGPADHVGRRGARAADRHQPHRERGEVHATRRTDRRAPHRARRASAPRGGGHRRRHRARGSCRDLRGLPPGRDVAATRRPGNRTRSRQAAHGAARRKRRGVLRRARLRRALPACVCPWPPHRRPRHGARRPARASTAARCSSSRTTRTRARC